MGRGRERLLTDRSAHFASQSAFYSAKEGDGESEAVEGSQKGGRI
jgi:hypothetical protein